MFVPQVRFRLWLLDSLYDAHRLVIGGNLSRPLRDFADVCFGSLATERFNAGADQCPLYTQKRPKMVQRHE